MYSFDNFRSGCIRYFFLPETHNKINTSSNPSLCLPCNYHHPLPSATSNNQHIETPIAFNSKYCINVYVRNSPQRGRRKLTADMWRSERVFERVEKCMVEFEWDILGIS